MLIRKGMMRISVGFLASLTGVPSVAALTQKECSAKYQGEKTAGTLGGKTWNDYRKTECAANAPAATSEPATKPAATAAPTKSPLLASPRRASLPLRRLPPSTPLPRLKLADPLAANLNGAAFSQTSWVNCVACAPQFGTIGRLAR
jgi:hypothetical protein